MFDFTPSLLALAADAENDLSEVFSALDELSFHRQKQVLTAFAEERVSAACFAPSSGYGTDDLGREVLDRVWAKVFDAEAALVRHNLVSGTHTIAVALFGLLRPGDVMLSVSGRPYDTLHGVIGLTEKQGQGSLIDFGVKYEEIDLKENGDIDLEAVRARLLKGDVRMVYLQKSPGYSTRRPIGNRSVAALRALLDAVGSRAVLTVDNCYAEFCEDREPPFYGADVCMGSLIKNAGGGMAECGGYIVGKEELIDLCAQRLTCPGIGGELGATLGMTKAMFKGLFYAPHTTAQALKTAAFAAAIFKRLGMRVIPDPKDARFDIVQQISLNEPRLVEAFCRGLQAASPVDSHAVPVPSPMPGYADEVIMAAGAFTQGSSIELSGDAPMRPPYTVYLQGGLTYESAKLGILNAAQAVLDARAGMKGESL